MTTVRSIVSNRAAGRQTGRRLGGGGGALAIALSFVVLGCGGGTETAQLPRIVSAPQIASLSETSYRTELQRLLSSEQVLAFRRAIGDLSAEEDPLSVATSRAVCAGMSGLQDQPDSVDEQEWSDFLQREIDFILRSQALHVPQPAVVSKANGVLTTLNLEQTSPSLARQYYPSCVAR